jgi:hypothetical protein
VGWSNRVGVLVPADGFLRRYKIRQSYILVVLWYAAICSCSRLSRGPNCPSPAFRPQAGVPSLNISMPVSLEQPILLTASSTLEGHGFTNARCDSTFWRSK